MAIRNLVIFIGIACVYLNLIGDEKAACAEKCLGPFGSLIGQAGLTQAFSNCNGDCVKDELNFVMYNQKQIASGMKWQCVEYARRWLIENRHITFPEVQFARCIWELPEGTSLDTNQPVPLLKFANRVSKTPPQVGDLLIYHLDFGPTGHVAVVVAVDSNSVYVAEQNYFNDVWEKPNYSRRLLLDKNEQGQYRIFDDCLYGWVRLLTAGSGGGRIQQKKM